jgi:hypothetical protein
VGVAHPACRVSPERISSVDVMPKAALVGYAGPISINVAIPTKAPQSRTGFPPKLTSLKEKIINVACEGCGRQLASIE